MEQRPALSPSLKADDLHKWYWLKEELVSLARSMNLSTTGSKNDLVERLTMALNGQDAMHLTTPKKRSSGNKQLSDPLERNTVIPEGQRCSQTLRAFFEHHIGSTFHFDKFMRDFIANGAGKTLGEAIEYWHSTRELATQPSEIDNQFEYNRFTRQWFNDHPNGTRAEAVAAWWEHRSKPRN